MTPIEPSARAPRPRVGAVFAWMMIIWTAVVVAFLWREVVSKREELVAVARASADESFSKDLAYRRWATSHGGVYVPVTPQTPPSPYLAHVPERDIVTPGGRRLTLINPAYMIRQIHEMARSEFGLRGHITSLKPLRPENSPDAWERSALEALEHGAPAVSSLEELDGQRYLRFIRPLLVETGCIKCHGHQGYRVGDIRGGVSVSVPWAPFEAKLWSASRDRAIGFGFLWALGLAGLLWGDRRVQALMAERQGFEQERLRAQKLEALGTLAGGIAHDFNNILSAIRGNADLASQDVGAGHPAAESLAEIRKAALRAAELVRRITTFGRPSPAQACRVDLPSVVDEALQLLRATMPAGIRLAREFDAATPAVVADSGQLHEAVVNLTTNAAWAIRAGKGKGKGTITFRVEPADVDERLAAVVPGLAPGAYARLTVADTGCGMDEATLARVFDAFFTTKPTGEGTGLGLSMVHGIVQSCGGAIAVRSARGAGASFDLYFPAAPAEVAAPGGAAVTFPANPPEQART